MEQFNSDVALFIFFVIAGYNIYFLLRDDRKSIYFGYGWVSVIVWIYLALGMISLIFYLV